QCVDARLGCVLQRRVQRAVVRARGSLGVVRGGRAGEPTPEILRVVELLPDERRAHGLAIFHDEAAVGVARKGALGDAGNYERIGGGRDEGHGAENDDRGAELLREHGEPSYVRLRTTRTRSMALMPMNGTMTPPSP